MVIDFVAVFVSAEVESVEVAGPVVVGLLTSLSTTDNASPASTAWPSFKVHTTVVPFVLEQSLLTVWPDVVSVIVPPAKYPKVVPAGSATVTALPE
jgi:hypothetical protein